MESFDFTQLIGLSPYGIFCVFLVWGIRFLESKVWPAYLDREKYRAEYHNRNTKAQIEIIATQTRLLEQHCQIIDRLDKLVQHVHLLVGITGAGEIDKINKSK